MRNPFKPKHQDGFTLIEMMIAMAISSFLMLVIMVMFSSSNRSRMLQTSLSGLNESGRFAISVLGRDLRMAGYKDDNWLTGAIPNTIVVANGAPVDGGDSITIQYEAARDCNYAATVGGMAVNTYALNMANMSLECNGQPIVDDIEQMQIYFGEDTDADGVANRMMAPGEVGLNMNRVVSLRVHLLVRSTTDRQSETAQQYFFDDVTWDAPDTRMRRQYSITVALRNPI
jgi:type IV pilus assembly protein PilW